MLEKIRKLKDHKGFTLVELIVVLVILAILAALLVPALTGYIDKANQDKVAAECRQVVIAAQTSVSEAYGKGTLDDLDVNDILTLAEAKSDWRAAISYLTKANGNTAAGTVVKVVFTDGTNGCTYAWNSTSNTFEYTANGAVASDDVTSAVTGVDTIPA